MLTKMVTEFFSNSSSSYNIFFIFFIKCARILNKKERWCFKKSIEEIVDAENVMKMKFMR